MSYSELRKEFTTKDVTRLRNLISGNVNAATVAQVGYTKKEVDYKEGDVWEVDGRKWTVKDGVKQTFTQLDGIKKLIRVPMLCPECSVRMKHRLDKQMYNIHGKCLACVQSFETKLKLEGKYTEYAEGIMKANARTFVKEAREYIQDIATEMPQYFTETGQIEDWSGPNVNQLAVEKMEQELAELEETLSK